MKKYKFLFLIFISGLLVTCTGTSEEKLVGDWERRAEFPVSGRAHAATFVIGDWGYVVGGTIGTREFRTDVVAFNHTAGDRDRRRLDDVRTITMGSWRRLKNTPQFSVVEGVAEGMRPRQQAVGFSLKVGEKDYGFVGAGMALDNQKRDFITLKDFWKYDPDKEGSDDAWTQIAPLPDDFLPRRGAIAFSLNKGSEPFGYVGFGYEDEPDKNYLLDLWEYDPRNDTWTEVFGYSGRKRNGAMVFVIDNKAYICGGDNPALVYDFWVFDPNAPEGQNWESRRTMRDADPNEDFDDDYRYLSRSFGVAYVALVDNQLRGHIVGSTSTLNSSGFTNWEYNHTIGVNGKSIDLWEERTSFFNADRRTTRAGMVSFSFPNGRAFVGLGLSGQNLFHEDLWEFFPLEEDYVYNDW